MTKHLSDAMPVICGVGAALPQHYLSNDDIHHQHGLEPSWIETRTGIHKRYRAGSETKTSDLATAAARQALASAGRPEVDLVIVATATPDHPVPATAPAVASRLGLTQASAFDVSAVCSGFVYGLAQAAANIRAGQAESALVIGAEVFSRLIAPTDAANQAIFGDGAGAVILRAGTAEDFGAVITSKLGSDGSGRNLIWAPGADSAEADFEYFQMDGREVFKHAVSRMTEVSKAVISESGWQPSDVDWIVPHQANKRILNQVAIALGKEKSSAITHLDEVGNTSAASIPLALARHHEKFDPGDKIVLAAFGGGLTWGATAITWPQGMHVPAITHI